MTTLLLVIIYIAFISLGLPDSILGSAWPSMYKGFDVPISYAGIISMIIAAGTIISSFFSDKLIKKLGTGLVTAISVGMTCVALLGFAFSNSFYQLCIWGIPYGLGAGSVDAALNNYVALNYKSRHMSWLHCFWGVGATAGPYIMGLCLTRGLRWNYGYLTIGIIQVILVVFLLVSLPLWKKVSRKNEIEQQSSGSSIRDTLKIKGVKHVLIAFFCYSTLEATTGLWTGSYMVLCKGITAETAAKWTSLFYLGITAGRLLSGFITDRVGDKNMIRGGQAMVILGIFMMVIPGSKSIMFIALMILGIGCAPIYPSIIHSTPDNFGADKSQSVIGMQMAFAYTGCTFMPPLFGLISQNISDELLPLYLFIFVILMIIMLEKLNRVKNKSYSQ